ncbi:Asp23/Gls24 family envelope stress response protein [Paeniglutamicibacter antarcticus]|uniref:Asp23/Gls24 family envelope stress response protein n=1 Tax=Arthrobacter terrae TaxID=2935737 RepID=A0A931G553_9MICC|nr:Asp23/Gls24 family envelope stress response protein [Arthrobacter terrae]MBG0740456.1 Asp23/Gls24 family envelope stress response protein [Arthrobacter terrae]
MALDDEPRLGCGRSIDRIWTTIDQPLNAHEQTCRQCQAARAQLKRLNEATQALREADLHDEALTPRSGVKTAIMDVARAEIRRSKRILLASNGNGTTEISEQALSSVIRAAAAEVPGIHARRCHIEISSATSDSSVDDPPSGQSGVIGPHLVIGLRSAVAPDINIPRTVQLLRQRIITAIPAGIGISAGTINITVEDLYDV